MAYSATLANNRKLITDAEHRRLLGLFSRAGLSMDHHQFDEDILSKATAAILKTRDGLLRAAVPNPICQCTFLNDVSAEEMNGALRRHKQLMKEYPRNGEGLEAYVDASDTGYTENLARKVENVIHNAAKKGDSLGGANGQNDNRIDSMAKESCKVNGKVMGTGKPDGVLTDSTTGNYKNAMNGAVKIKA
jgi:3-dehydroquinate synthase